MPTPAGNIATGKPAWLRSADDSHELGPSLTAYASLAVDGLPGTVAQGAYKYAWSLKVDLRELHTIRRVAVVFDPSSSATHYRILTSLDNQKWTIVVDEENGKPQGGTDNIAPIEARWVRVQAVKPDGPN